MPELEVVHRYAHAPAPDGTHLRRVRNRCW